MLCMMDQVSLPKHGRCEYNEREPCCSYASSNAPISPRRGSIRALCLHLNQATGLFQLSRDPPPFFAVDQAIDDLTFAQNVCRCDQRKSRTACEKCPVTTPTDHSSATDQTTDLQEAGSAPLDCIGSLGYPFHNNALMMSTTAIFAYLSTERARFSTKLFPCLFWNGYPK